MLSRRHVLLSAGAMCCAGPAMAYQAPATPELNFQVLRDGSRIGTHSLRFTPVVDGLTITVEVRLAVYLGPVRMFHYNHDTVERWRNGAFQSLDSKTDYDGDPAFSTVRRENGALIVEGSKAPRYTASANTLPATHWNSAELAGPMINPENGKLLMPRITDKGPCSVALASGANVTARQYDWRGTTEMELWYDQKDVWAKLTAKTGDGSQLVYERL